uniref:Uncharacterized protein n=1 Tax=viral metagenome TaxID=1070528 RepID=A0A6C0BQL5_9ZZZZ
MEQFIHAAITAVLYVIIRSAYSKYSPDDALPPKQLVKEGVVVFIACVAASYISMYTDTNIDAVKKNLTVLTSAPDF